MTTFAPGAGQPVLGQHCSGVEECPWLFKPRGWAAQWAKEICRELSQGSMILSPMGASQGSMPTSLRPYSRMGSTDKKCCAKTDLWYLYLSWGLLQSLLPLPADGGRKSRMDVCISVLKGFNGGEPVWCWNSHSYSELVTKKKKKVSKLVSSPYLLCHPCERNTARRHRAQADGHVVLSWKEIPPLHSNKGMIHFKA